MKKILILLLCLLLSSCSLLNTLDITNLEDVFSRDQEYLKIRRNEYSDYYEYYLPSDMVIYSYESLSSVMQYNDSKIIANINISGILNNRYYGDSMIQNEGYFDSSKLVFQKESFLLNMDEEEVEYKAYVYDYGDKYFVYLISKDITIYSYANRNDIVPVCSRLLLFMKSVSVNETYIMEDFSNRDVIELEKKQLNLFETVRPVNGVVNDMMVDDYNPGPDE